jgi:hypothetical protein
MQLPDVRVSFLGVMTALAAGPKGSRFILAQFRQNATKAELEHFTWRKLFATVIAYCRCGRAYRASMRVGAQCTILFLTALLHCSTIVVCLSGGNVLPVLLVYHILLHICTVFFSCLQAVRGA